MDQRFIEAVELSIEPAVRDFNERRLPALEQAWGRSYQAEMANESQQTVETTKNYSRPINNSFYREIQSRLPEFEEQTTNGSDYRYGEILIEDKNSFGSGNSWVGNGFLKTPMHLLKKFEIDDQGRITHAFVAVVDISLCQGAWTEKTTKTNRSELKFLVADREHIRVIMGRLAAGRRYLQPIPVRIG